MDSHSGGVEVQNGALKRLSTSGRLFPSLWWGAGYGSALNWRWIRILVRITLKWFVTLVLFAMVFLEKSYLIHRFHF